MRYFRLAVVSFVATCLTAALVLYAAPEESDEVVLRFRQNPGTAREYNYESEFDVRLSTDFGGIGEISQQLTTRNSFRLKQKYVKGPSASGTGAEVNITYPEFIISNAMELNLMGQATDKIEIVLSEDGVRQKAGGVVGPEDAAYDQILQTLRETGLAAIIGVNGGIEDFNTQEIQDLNHPFKFASQLAAAVYNLHPLLPDKAIDIGDKWTAQFHCGGSAIPIEIDMECKMVGYEDVGTSTNCIKIAVSHQSKQNESEWLKALGNMPAFFGGGDKQEGEIEIDFLTCNGIVFFSLTEGGIVQSEIKTEIEFKYTLNHQQMKDNKINGICRVQGKEIIKAK
ncbi:hypothetical protein ACFL54_04415 [Planctomycetota bacterium]